MECNNCGNKEAFRMQFNKYGECCDVCGRVNAIWFPDVFFNGKPEETLPISFGSRIEKALYLRANNLYEAGDKYHGAFRNYNGISRPIDKIQNKEEVKRVLHMVKNMGKDYKRQEFLRIKAQSER